MRWTVPASATVHGLLVLLFALFWQQQATITTAPLIELAMIQAAAPLPVPTAPPPAPLPIPVLAEPPPPPPPPEPVLEKVVDIPPEPVIESLPDVLPPAEEPEVVIPPKPKPRPKKRPSKAAEKPPEAKPAPQPQAQAVAAPAEPAPVQTDAAPAPAAAAPAAPQGPSGPPPDYLSAVLARLEKYKQYPPEAVNVRLAGTAVLRFELARDGHVTQWRIVKSAGYPSLDRAVRRMIEQADPLPPVPPEIAAVPMELEVPVSFRLK